MTRTRILALTATALGLVRLKSSLVNNRKIPAALASSSVAED